MKKENILLVLWIIFGYLFVTSINAVINLLIHIVYFGLSEMKVSYNNMSVIVPIISIVLYAVSTIIIVRKINIKSKTNGIYLTQFPKNLTIILGFISFFLSPITNKLSGLYAEHNTGNLDIEYLNFYSWLYLSIGISQLLMILILVIIFLNKLKQIQ